MMTNVDYEGFKDWTDTELEEALKTISKELNDRKQKQIFKDLDKVEKAIAELQNTNIKIDYIYFLNGEYSLADIFENIKLYYKERMKQDERP